jgi:homogentisate 1,2-dioxygenase
MPRQTVFVPGGLLQHIMTVRQGSAATASEGASNAELAPEKQAYTMSFIFSTRIAAVQVLLPNRYSEC